MSKEPILSALYSFSDESWGADEKLDKAEAARRK